MKLLYLGPLREHIFDFLCSMGDEVMHCEGAVDDARIEQAGFIVSYSYKHILSPEITSRFSGKAINLHISLLPWNRGADPNLWSFLEDTPKGVTIHYIDPGIDTGDILAARVVAPVMDDTLRTSYLRLENAVEQLFFEQWLQIRAGTAIARRQPNGGSFHRARDRESVAHLLTAGWDTPVAGLIGKAPRK